MAVYVGGFKLLKDLPTFLETFPKAVQQATIAGQREALLTWRDRPVNPGLAWRFTWDFAKGGRTSMRRGKYGSPTTLRINAAKAGLPPPRESMPGRGRKHLRLGVSGAPNASKPWFVSTGGTKAKILARRPISRVYGGVVASRLSGSGLGINLLAGAAMKGVLTATWIKAPITYQMRVYKDAVNRTGAYTVTVTRAIGRWVYTYSSRNYKQEYEDVSEDLPWIKSLAENAIRSLLRDLVVDGRGRVRVAFRKAVAAGRLSASELSMITEGT